jgi:hypothetical protein
MQVIEGTLSSTYVYASLILSSSWVLGLIGFVVLLGVHNQKMSELGAKKTRVKPALQKSAFLTMIYGLGLTIPGLIQFYPYLIGDVLVSVGFVLILVSPVIWIITLFFPRDFNQKIRG